MTRLYILILNIRPTILTNKCNQLNTSYFQSNRILRNINNDYLEAHFTPKNKEDIEMMRVVGVLNDELWIYMRVGSNVSKIGKCSGGSIMEYVGKCGVVSFVLNVEECVEEEGEELIVKEEEGRSIYLV